MSIDSIDLLRKFLKSGEVFFVELTKEDGLILRGEFDSRRKYLVIVGYNEDIDKACGILLNSNDHGHISNLLKANSYKIDDTHYPEFLNKETFADCSLLVKIDISRLVGRFIGNVTDADLMMILRGIWNSPFLHEIDLIEYNVRKVDD